MVELGEQWRSLRHYYLGTRGLRRELLALVICLSAGLLLMPCLIFAAGRLSLGPYAHGNLFALWHDFIEGLIAGSWAAWFIAVAPYGLFWLLRGGRRLLHN